MNKTSFEQQVDGALRFSFFVKLCGTANNWHESCLTGMQHEVLYISALRYICQQNLDYEVEYERQRTDVDFECLCEPCTEHQL